MNIYSLKQITTPRLIIRPVQLGDEIEVNQIIQNSLEELQKWEPWARSITDDTMQMFMQRGVFTWLSQSVADFPMVIIHKKEQKIIGECGFNDWSIPSAGEYQPGYWIDVSYQGKGYATECANALTHFALTTLKAQKVIINIDKNNVKSLAIPKRLNFHFKGDYVTNFQDGPHQYTTEHQAYVCKDPKELPPLDIKIDTIELDHHTAKSIQWARKALELNEERRFAGSEVIHRNKWSTVIRFYTEPQESYLKQLPDKAFIEKDILQYFNNNLNMKGIQELLAYNDEMNSFITKGCGRITLRDYFNHDLNTELLVKGIQIYKNIQANTSDNKILDLGLANWQLENWGALFIDCFNDLCTVIDSAIKSRIEENIDTLKLDIQTEANKLEQFKIKSCYNHCDLHDNNFIYAPETNEVTLIDLGESSYSNPIFSLLGLLEHTKNRYQLSENSDEYQSLYQACFNDYEAKFTDFKHVLELVEKLSPLYFLLSMKQFIQIIGLDVFIDTPKNIKNLNHTFNSLLNNFLTI